jgi:segregation and condensation protein A
MTGLTAQIDIRAYDSPLELLSDLLEKNRIDIYEIPIAEITDQYLAVLEELETLNMDLASEFLVMAATLLQLKSYSLLPSKKIEPEAEDDSRDELVLKLLRYRQCRLLAVELNRLHQIYADSVLRLPEPPARLGITQEYVEDSLDFAKFQEAVLALETRNRNKYHDLRQNVRYLLRRERVSIKDKVKEILRQVWRKKKIWFHELYPPASSSKMEQATGFLAMLELMRQNRITVIQKIPYGAMRIEKGLLLQEEDIISGVEIVDEDLLL